MRITFIMGKFNLKSSTSSDFLLKCKILKELGHEVGIVTTFSHQNVIPENFPYKLYEEQILGTRLLALQKFAVEILKKYSEKTDIFYLASDIFAFGGGWYRKFVKNSKPVVMYFNGYMDFVEPYFKKFPLWPKKYLTTEKKFKHKIRIFLELTIGVWLINELDKIFIINKAVADYYLQAGIKKEKVIIMSDFYDLDFLTNKFSFSNPFDIYPKNTFHILFTGRLYIDKGADILINAFLKINCLKNCMLHIVGDGEMKNELKDLVHKLNLTSKVVFYGWKNAREIISFYQHANLYVQPTRLPGPINRVVIEAMVNGLPVVATSSSKEVWAKDDKTIKTFKHGDIESLKNSLEQMFGDENMRKLMSKNSRLLARDYDYKRLGKKLHDILNGLNNMS